MLNKPYRSLLALCVLGAISAFSTAQEIACRSIVNDPDRLACYDKAVIAIAANAATPDTIEKKALPPALSTG